MKRIVIAFISLIMAIVQFQSPVLAMEKVMEDETTISEEMKEVYIDFFESKSKSIVLEGQDVTDRYLNILEEYYYQGDFQKISDFTEEGYILQFNVEQPSTKAVEQRVNTLRLTGLDFVNNYPGGADVVCRWVVDVTCVYNVNANTGYVTNTTNPYITLVLAEIGNAQMVTPVLANQSSYIDAVLFNSVRFGYGFTVAAHAPLYPLCPFMTFKTVHSTVTY